ncbi:hypothetical protein BJ546DRAFT_949825 [Cryomyces antarcticus]
MYARLKGWRCLAIGYPSELWGIWIELGLLKASTVVKVKERSLPRYATRQTCQTHDRVSGRSKEICGRSEEKKRRGCAGQRAWNKQRSMIQALDLPDPDVLCFACDEDEDEDEDKDEDEEQEEAADKGSTAVGRKTGPRGAGGRAGRLEQASYSKTRMKPCRLYRAGLFEETKQPAAHAMILIISNLVLLALCARGQASVDLSVLTGRERRGSAAQTANVTSSSAQGTKAAGLEDTHG